MRELKTLLIINPNSGPFHRRRNIPKLMKRLQAHFPSLEIAFTKKGGDALIFAKNGLEKNVKLILCAGGDGTINEVVNAIYGTDAILGILPTGTGNGLARDAGFSMDPFIAMEQLITGTLTSVYPGLVNEKLFLLVSGAGFNAYVAQQTDQNYPRLKKLTGFLSYLIVAQITGLRYPFPLILVTLDGRNHFCYGLVVLKSSIKIGSLKLAPSLSLQSNQLGVFLFKKKGLYSLFRFMISFFFQSHLRHPHFSFYLCNEVTATSNESVPVQSDGEVTHSLPAQWNLSKKGIQMIFPKGKL
ncbi:MAG: diacylglycerol kinase family lipid kinase [Nitrospirae bacterium]|nr:diacylglycerol kinase family lipid kinase [Nitrospirota bacterium]